MLLNVKQVVLSVDTLVHNSAKYIDPTWCGGTVPAAIPELVLTLSVTMTCMAVRSRGSCAHRHSDNASII